MTRPLQPSDAMASPIAQRRFDASEREAGAASVQAEFGRGGQAERLVNAHWDAVCGTRWPADALSHRAMVRAFLAHRLPADAEAMVAIGLDGGRPVAAVALQVMPHPWLPSFVVAETLGDFEVPWFDLRVAHEGGSFASGALLSRLPSEIPRLFALRVPRIPAEARLLEVLRRVPGYHVRVLPAGVGSYLPVPASIELYLKGLSSNFRKNLRKQEARLRQLSNVRVELVDAARLGEADLERVVRLEASGWKGAAGTAIGNSPETLSYYREVFRLAADAGGPIELHFLHADDELLAAHIAVRSERVLILLKIAYNERYAHCGPGNMLFLEILRREVAGGRTDVIDCLTDMAWHRNWRMDSRSYVELFAYPRRPVPILLGAFPGACADVLRRWPLARRAVRALRRAARTMTPRNSDSPST